VPVPLPRSLGALP